MAKADDRRGTATGAEVVVVGAGYAGVLAANRLRGSLTAEEAERVHVTVVNPTDRFVERIRLHELAAGTRATATLPLGDQLHADVRLLVGSAERIDVEARTVTVATEAGIEELAYDKLVYAVGSRSSDAIPGSRDHAFLLSDLEGAEAARQAIAAGDRGQRVLVVGGGLTGVEAASELAEAHPDAHVVLLSSGGAVPAMRPQARRSITAVLERLGVEVVDGSVAAIEAGVATLVDGRTVPFDVALVAASFAVPELAATSGLGVDEGGRLLVDESLHSLSSPAVLGAGDATVLADGRGAHLRMACATALPLGAHVADTILAELRGRPVRPLSLGCAAQCISLGRKAGYIQLVRADDTPRPLHLGGRVGARVKELVCRLVVVLSRREAAHPGTYRAPKGPRPTATTARPTSAAEPIATEVSAWDLVDLDRRPIDSDQHPTGTADRDGPGRLAVRPTR